MTMTKNARLESVKTVLRLRPVVNNADPGHSWYRVPFMTLIALNISDKISNCSYVSHDGRDVWLEEDCDAGIFFKALANAGIDYDRKKIIQVIRDNQSEVRTLPSYKGGN